MRDADLIVTVTASREPIIQDDWMASRATLIAVGSDGPEKQEVAPRVLQRADKVIADRTAQ